MLTNKLFERKKPIISRNFNGSNGVSNRVKKIICSTIYAVIDSDASHTITEFVSGRYTSFNLRDDAHIALLTRYNFFRVA